MYTIKTRIQQQYASYAEKAKEAGREDPSIIFNGFIPCLGIFGLFIGSIFPLLSFGLIELIFYIGNHMGDTSNNTSAPFLFFIVAVCYVLFIFSFLLSFPSVLLLLISLVALFIAPFTCCLSFLAILGLIIIPAFYEESYIEIGEP